MTGQIECHECGNTDALAMITVRGPNAYDPAAVVRDFCCVQCFWMWIDRVIADRNKGGRLDRQVCWD